MYHVSDAYRTYDEASTIIIDSFILLGSEFFAAVEAEEEFSPGPFGGPVADLVVEGEPLDLDDLFVILPEVGLHLLKVFSSCYGIFSSKYAAQVFSGKERSIKKKKARN